MIDRQGAGFLTGLTVRLSVLQVEGVVADGLLAAGAQEAVHMPGLLQGVDDFLLADEKHRLAVALSAAAFLSNH